MKSCELAGHARHVIGLAIGSANCLALGVTTRKCFECTTSWTKHERAARCMSAAPLMAAARVAAGVTSLTCHEPTSVETDAAEDPTGYNVDQVRKEFRRAETKTVNLNQI